MDVTFCVPTYNRLELLKQTLNSIYALHDLDKWNYEVLVSDDSSNDLTQEYINNSKFEKLVYFKNKNHGQFNNLNNLLSQKLGDLVVILHDDDLLDPTYLMYLGTMYDEHKSASVMYCNRRLIDLAGKPLGEYPEVSSTSTYELSGKIIADFNNFGHVPSDASYVCTPMVTGIAFRKEHLNKVGLFDTDLYVNSDSLFLTKLFYYAETILYVKQPIVTYRVLDISERSRPAKDGVVFTEMQNLFNKNMLFYKQELDPSEYSIFKVRKENEFLEFNAGINAPLLWIALRCTLGYVQRLRIQMGIFKFVVLGNSALLYKSLVLPIFILSLMPQKVLNYLYSSFMRWL